MFAFDGFSLMCANSIGRLESPCDHLLWFRTYIAGFDVPEDDTVYYEHPLWKLLDPDEQSVEYISDLEFNLIRDDCLPRIAYRIVDTGLELDRANTNEAHEKILMGTWALLTQDTNTFIRDALRMSARPYRADKAN